MSTSTSTSPLSRHCRTTTRSRVLGLGFVAILLAWVCVLSLVIGTHMVPLGTVWQAVTDYRDSGGQWIVHDLRLPRTVLGLLVGLALGLSGTLIQAVGRNPLADAHILGINSGAGLCVVSAVALMGITSIWAYMWFAFAGALAAMMVVYFLGVAARATVTPVRLLLTGVAVGAVMEGISFIIRLGNPRAFDNMRFWDAGALDGRSYDIAMAVAPFIVVGAVMCLFIARSLNVTSLGDDIAKSVGGNTVRIQIVSLLMIAMLAGAATAAAGPIGFVGLVIPHIVRWFTGPDWRWILAYACLLGPILLIGADILGRIVIRPAELPAGIVTAFLGAPVLIWLIHRYGQNRVNL